METLPFNPTAEQGFTLVELLVVIAIIAILTAIAVPTFLSQRGKAYDAAVASDARNATMMLMGDLEGAGEEVWVDELIADYPRTKGVQMEVAMQSGTDYCLATWHESGKSYNEEAPLFYDSTDGRFTPANEVVSGSLCEGYAGGGGDEDWEDEDETPAVRSLNFFPKIETTMNVDDNTMRVRVTRTVENNDERAEGFPTTFEVQVNQMEPQGMNIYTQQVTLTEQDAAGQAFTVTLPNDTSLLSNIFVTVNEVSGEADGINYNVWFETTQAIDLYSLGLDSLTWIDYWHSLYT